MKFQTSSRSLMHPIARPPGGVAVAVAIIAVVAWRVWQYGLSLQGSPNAAR